jgi:hypothetical protein
MAKYEVRFNYAGDTVRLEDTNGVLTPTVLFTLGDTIATERATYWGQGPNDPPYAVTEIVRVDNETQVSRPEAEPAPE